MEKFSDRLVFRVLRKMKISLSLFLTKISENPSTRRIFLGASENEKVGNFSVGRNRWKDSEKNQPLFLGASQNKNISAIASGENF